MAAATPNQSSAVNLTYIQIVYKVARTERIDQSLHNLPGYGAQEVLSGTCSWIADLFAVYAQPPDKVTQVLNNRARNVWPGLIKYIFKLVL